MVINVGDEIIVKNHGKEFYDAGAGGVVVKKVSQGCLIEFKTGVFKRNRSNNSWFVGNPNMKLKEKE